MFSASCANYSTKEYAIPVETPKEFRSKLMSGRVVNLIMEATIVAYTKNHKIESK